MDRLEFEITHRCNKHCDGCSHRILTSSYGFMSRQEYRHIVSCVDPDEICEIMVIGGEPLLHPDLYWLVASMVEDFPGLCSLEVWTNGKLLPWNDWLFDFNEVKVVLSRYGKWNEAVAERYRGREQVVIQEPVWYDVAVNPNLDEETAREVRERCHYNVRLIGTKLYNCCLSEPIEREHKTAPVHVKIDVNWKLKFYQIPTWRACRFCFRAVSHLQEVSHG